MKEKMENQSLGREKSHNKKENGTKKNKELA